MVDSSKNAIDPKAVLKESDHRFLLTGTMPPSLLQLHKAPAIIPIKYYKIINIVAARDYKNSYSYIFMRENMILHLPKMTPHAIHN